MFNADDSWIPQCPHGKQAAREHGDLRAIVKGQGLIRIVWLLQVAGRPAVAGKQRVVVARAAASTLTRREVPLKLEEGELPLNTYNNKKPFKGKIVSVERIVGPKATGETCNIVIETNGDIPFWEGQSYGVIPPVSFTLQQTDLLTLLACCRFYLVRLLISVKQSN